MKVYNHSSLKRSRQIANTLVRHDLGYLRLGDWDWSGSSLSIRVCSAIHAVQSHIGNRNTSVWPWRNWNQPSSNWGNSSQHEKTSCLLPT
jgi:hypothetical protein